MTYRGVMVVFLVVGTVLVFAIAYGFGGFGLGVASAGGFLAGTAATRRPHG